MVNMEHFLASEGANAWIESMGYSVYARKAAHYVDGSVKDTVDIASVQRLAGSPRRFWELVQRTGEAAKFRLGIEYVFIENVLNPTLAQSLRRRQWTEIYDACVPSFYIKVSDLNVWHSKG